MPKPEELPSSSVLKRQATQYEINAIRKLEELVGTGKLNDWEDGFIKSMFKRLVDTEEFSSKKVVLMISEKQAESLQRVMDNVANKALEDTDLDPDDFPF